MLTKEEQALLDKIDNAFQAFVALPVMYHTDIGEVSSHINALQNMVLARPTLRARQKV